MPKEPGSVTADHGVWQAGVARVDVTPPIGVWLCGFGGRKRPAEGIHDPLHITAAVFERGGVTVAVVSCDVLSIDAVDVARVRSAIAQKTEIPPQNILIHATHTHAGPITSSMRGFGPRDAAYESIFFRQIATAVELAHGRLEPIRLTFGTADASVGINRREGEPGSIVLGENPDGPVDNRTAVLAAWPLATEVTQPRFLVVWAAVHPVLFGADNYLYGRDFPHFAITRLETAFPGTPCLYLTGACGDVNPLGMRSADRFDTARRHGERLAGAALEALAAGRELEKGPIGAVQHWMDVPYEAVPPLNEVRALLQAWEAEVPVASPGGEETRRTTDHRLHWAHDALKALEGRDPDAPLPLSIPTELQVVRLGELTFTAMPFEVFTEYQWMVDAAAQGYESLVVGYANGNYGYLPTRAAFDEGGYEVDRAWWFYTLSQMSKEAPATVRAGIERVHHKMQQGTL